MDISYSIMAQANGIIDPNAFVDRLHLNSSIYANRQLDYYATQVLSTKKPEVSAEGIFRVPLRSSAVHIEFRNFPSGYVSANQLQITAAYDVAIRGVVEPTTYRPNPCEQSIGGSVSAARSQNGIQATFQPLATTLQQAADICGVDHFNWVQRITSIPASWRLVEIRDFSWSTVEVNGKVTQVPNVKYDSSRGWYDPQQPDEQAPFGIASTPLPALDPLLNGKDVLYGIEVDVEIDGHRTSRGAMIPQFGTDDKLPAYDYGSDVLEVNTFDYRYDSAGTQFQFFDHPVFHSWMFQPGEFVEFETELVGMDKAGNVIKKYDPSYGTSIRWKSNATSSKMEGFELFSSEVPSLDDITGGVFDIRYVVPEPSGYAQAVIALIAMGVFSVCRFRTSRD
jgi:hypothetical protein